MKAGVKGYLLKNSSLDELVRAVHALAQGGAYFSSTMFTKVLQEFTHLSRRRDLQEVKGIDALTEREKDVLRLVAKDGWSSPRATRRISVAWRYKGSACA